MFSENHSATMPTQVSMPGSAQWRQANASQLNALIDRVMQQTGQRGLAEDAARAAENALTDLYHQAMVNSGGNQQTALQAVQHHTQSVFRLAGLVPQITGNDSAAASSALRQAQQVLRDAGINDPQFLYPWLRSNVSNDQVLRGAGLDPQRVRHVDSPWAHADLQGLMGIAREMLTQYRGSDGQRLNDQEISSYMDQAWNLARQHGIGSQYVVPAPADPTATDSTDGSTETFTVQDVNVPRRV